MPETTQPLTDRISREKFFERAGEMLADRAVESIGVLIRLPGEQGNTLEISDKVNFEQRLRMYDHSYNDQLELRSNVFVRIVDIVPFRINLATISRNGADPTR